MRHTRSSRGALAPPFLFLVVALATAVATRPAPAQELTPRAEDAALPSSGRVRIGAAPVFQAWHLEFAADGSEVPLAEDVEGPLLQQVSPGPEAVVDGLNDDAGALGFSPLAPGEASVGELSVDELAAETRAVAFTVEVGLLDRLSADVMVPVVRTEVEPFLSLDPSGATLGGAALAVPEPAPFFGSISDARGQLESRLDAGQIPADREDEARALLESSGLFASTLQSRVDRNALLPLGGTPAGSQIEAFYAQLRDGFQSFGLALPAFSLPTQGDAAFLDDFFLGALASDPPGAAVRGWLAGETEVGLRFAVLRGFDDEAGGLQLRTSVGARARLPFRDPNAVAFIDPSSVFGLPLGDGQRDVELSVYQDLRVGSLLEVSATVRYGLQLADELTMSLRAPDRPLAPQDQRAEVRRDLGDYVRARLSPRLRLNPFLALGLEYRYWHKGRDRYTGGGGLDVSVLELQTEQTRHRLGVGASYRPFASDGDEAGAEPESGEPEIGFAYQTSLAGSGGQTPAAGLATFRVVVPVDVF